MRKRRAGEREREREHEAACTKQRGEKARR